MIADSEKSYSDSEILAKKALATEKLISFVLQKDMAQLHQICSY